MSAIGPTSAPSLRVIAIGAVTGAVASTGALALFALLSGKALAAAAIAKPAAGLPAAAGVSRTSVVKGLLDLVLPGSVGAASGGALGAGLARRQVRQALAPLRKEVGDLARQVLRAVDEPGTGGPAPEGGAPRPDLPPDSPSGSPPNPPPGSGPDAAAARELERIHGIGPRYAALLAAGGVRGLADLARADPAQLKQLLGVSAAAPMAAPARWITEARKLAATTEFPGAAPTSA